MRSEHRSDLKQWQEDQSEWFDGTTLEIVAEYAEWRDKQKGEVEPTTYEVTDVINIVSDLVEANAIDLAFGEVHDRMEAYGCRIALPPEVLAILQATKSFNAGTSLAREIEQVLIKYGKKMRLERRIHEG